METTLYADVLFFVNFSMDFISVWAASLLSGRERSLRKMSLAAAIGALFGVFAVIFGLSGIFSYISAGAVSILMSLCAFGYSGSFSDTLKQSAIIWGSGALLGGIMTAFLSAFGKVDSESTSPDGIITVCAAALLYIIVRIITGTKQKKCVTLKITHSGKTVSFSALCDSGNLLRDPISGTAVISVSKEALSPLIEVNMLNCMINNKISGDFPLKIRFIPHKTSTGDSLSAAFLPSEIIVSSGKEKKKIHALLLPVDCPKTFFAGYSATVPSSLI